MVITRGKCKTPLSLERELYSSLPLFWGSSRARLLGAFVAVPCVGVGLPLAGISFFQARKREGPLGMPIAGLATIFVALFITIGALN